PQGSSLFPYTTLFRSAAALKAEEEAEKQKQAAKVCKHIVYQNIGTDGEWTTFRFMVLTTDQRDAEGIPEAELLIESVREMETDQDRKSTRLNSSHDQN